MMKRIFSVLIAISLTLCVTTVAFAEEGSLNGGTYTFTDRQGNVVTAPVNAFAYRVVQFTPGSPWRSASTNTDPSLALGLPDADDSNSSTGDLCLGNNGVLVLEFDTPIFDGSGNDIYIFEVGGNVESSKIEVSNDLKTWYFIGIAEGSTAGLDFTGKVPAGSSFKYVRVTDSGENPSGGWPGADIDAVCGLNTKPVAAVTKTVTLAYRSIKINIDGKTIQPMDAQGRAVEPFIISGTTYLPLRAVSGALGCDVAWDESTSTITLTSGASRISRDYAGVAHNGTEQASITYRGIRIILDGKHIIPKDADGTVLDPFIKDGTTYLPVRAVASALGCEVGWDNATSTVYINS
ncbi:MAG: copper amine oxidase N-terminal domain-containing protein [Oscillospiraceae bacterium]|nr:copper amine oxidase N-terminal domain-containing protein [Oscillospiraceae bacterium]